MTKLLIGMLATWVSLMAVEAVAWLKDRRDSDEEAFWLNEEGEDE